MERVLFLQHFSPFRLRRKRLSGTRRAWKAAATLLAGPHYLINKSEAVCKTRQPQQRGQESTRGAAGPETTKMAKPSAQVGRGGERLQHPSRFPLDGWACPFVSIRLAL